MNVCTKMPTNDDLAITLSDNIEKSHHTIPDSTENLSDKTADEPKCGETNHAGLDLDYEPSLARLESDISDEAPNPNNGNFCQNTKKYKNKF